MSYIVHCKIKVFQFVCLMQETQRLMAEPVPGIQAVPDEGNARYFKVVVAGPKDVSKTALAISNWKTKNLFSIVFVGISFRHWLWINYSLSNGTFTDYLFLSFSKLL